MPEVSLKLEANITKLSGKGSRELNRIIKEKIVPIAMEIIAEEVKTKARENAAGVSLPPQRLTDQARHPIGKSESGNVLTNFLEKSIEINPLSNNNFQVVATTTYASWIEFGTGLFGPRGQPIKPVEKQALKFDTPIFGTIVAKTVKGQRPNPFMRGAVWVISDNPSEVFKKIQKKIDMEFK